MNFISIRIPISAAKPIKVRAISLIFFFGCWSGTGVCCISFMLQGVEFKYDDRISVCQLQAHDNSLISGKSGLCFNIKSNRKLTEQGMSPDKHRNWRLLVDHIKG